MSTRTTRRDVVKAGLTVAGLGALGFPEWALPALAQGETLVPFTDIPANLPANPSAERRTLDVRTIDGPFTPIDRWFTTQHYGHPVVDPATFRLKVTGLVERPLSLSLDELRRLAAAELVFGFECSGNRRPLQGACSNGRWTGVPLKAVLDRAGVRPQAREFVFFGADHGEEEADFRGTAYKLDQYFGRSLTREQVMAEEPFLAYALNGQPLTRHQGSPLRLLVPGRYGVSNVKWLAQVHLQEDPYVGKWQTRWYRTVWAEVIDGEVKWTETAVTRMRLKSFVARVTKDGNRDNVYRVLGVILHDGTPIKSVEVKVDDGAWRPATVDSATTATYSWKLFTYAWTGATPGEHTLVSRVIDVNGKIQPTLEELEIKKTFLEDNSQYPRKVMIS